MTWELSDGTKVHLGGKVEGESPLAVFLRAGAAGAKSGEGPVCYPDPLPSEAVPVDMRNVVHVDMWVRAAANCLDVAVLSGPDVPEAEDDPAPDSDDKTVVH